MRAVRPAVALALAIVALAGATVAASRPPVRAPGPPNVLLVVTDDQTVDTLPSTPPAMPWLQSQLADPASGWLRFTDAVVSTPMCCPSRATILTGLDALHTGVGGNTDGEDLDPSQTLPVWLRGGGYHTGLVGKYLNGFPFGEPSVPPGWDRFLAKTNDAASTVYDGYGLVDQGSFRRVGSLPSDYSTDLLGGAAVEFLRTAPTDRPWFLEWTPPAPHEPWIPAPRDAGAFAGLRLPAPSTHVLNGAAGKPAWVRSLPRIDAARLASLQHDRICERETLLDVDRWLEAIVGQIRARGEWDDTVVVFMSDNGYQFGEHRWVGKQAPYEGSLRVPLAIRSPWTGSAVVTDLVANLDVAPTIADLAGVAMPWRPDGVSLAPIVRGEAPSFGGQPPRWPGRYVPLLWDGSDAVPAWSGIRTATTVYVRDADGTQELYDLRSDPNELDNLAASRPRETARFAALQAEVAPLRPAG
ncbi:MAG: sulfatase [Planctomycetaceae bacterium]